MKGSAARAARIAAVLLIAFPSLLRAQEPPGRIEGKLTDDQGHGIPGAPLKLTPAEGSSKQSRTLKTGKDGSFHHAFVPRGTYRIESSDPNVFLKSLSYALKDDSGIVLMRQQGDADPDSGLPSFRLGPGQIAELTIVAASKEVRQNLSDTRALQKASGPLKEASELYEKGDMDGVVKITGEVISSNPNLATAHYLRGVALSRLKKQDEAIAELRKSLEIDHDQQGAEGALGVALLQQGLDLKKSGKAAEAQTSLTEATTHLERELQKTPGSSPLLTSQAIAMEELGRHEDLLRVLEQILKADPSNVKIRMKLADVQAKAHHDDEALKMLSELPRSEKAAADLLYDIAAQHFNDGATDGAVAAAKLGLEFNQDDYRLLRVLGRSEIAKGQTVEAIRNLEQSVAHAPASDPEVQHDRDMVETLKKSKP